MTHFRDQQLVYVYFKIIGYSLLLIALTPLLVFWISPHLYVFTYQRFTPLWMGLILVISAVDFIVVIFAFQHKEDSVLYYLGMFSILCIGIIINGVFSFISIVTISSYTTLTVMIIYSIVCMVIGKWCMPTKPKL